MAGTLELNPSDASEHYDEYLQTAKSKLIWRKQDPKYTKLQQRQETEKSKIENLEAKLMGLTPREIFEELITPDIFDQNTWEELIFMTG